MSWIEAANTKIEIFMGDGKSFFPEYMNAQKTQEFNSSSFEFPNVAGTLVRRKKEKGRTLKLDLIFQGADHLDVAADFENSSKDVRHWHVRHPYYGDIRVQPISIKYTNKDLNKSNIVCEVVETILDSYPKSKAAPQDEIAAQKDLSDQSAVFAFVDQTTVTGSDISQMNESVDVLEANAAQVIVDDEDSKNLLSTVAEARAAINKATTDLSNAMTKIKNVILLPARFNLDVFARQKLLLKQFDQLKELIIGTFAGVNDRKYYESTGSLLLSTAFFSSSIPQDGDFETSVQVINMVNEFSEYFNTYVEDLDNLQLDDLTKEDVYIPNYNNVADLENLHNLTISNLFDIALEAKQEVVKIVEKDTNLILLTHEVYGLDVDDVNLDKFVTTNEIGLNEHLLIKKGREVKYYV
jgi:hypothetical protein